MTVEVHPDSPVSPHASARAWHRFTAKTIATTNHLVVTGAIADDGYGRFHDPDYQDHPDQPVAGCCDVVRVSRWIWWAHHGPIPPGLVVLHPSAP